MKKNQSGVSLITLVITIIVVIILAMVAFGSSTQTITNANFSNFTNNVSEVQQAISEVCTTLKGNEAAKGTERNDAQVYNYAAKGATVLDASGESWLTRGMSQDLTATYVNPDTYEEVFGRDLPNMKVNTTNGSNKLVSYFLTRTGKVFIWPPYEYTDGDEDGLYVMPGEQVGYIGESNGTSGEYVVGTGKKLSYNDVKLEDIKAIVIDGTKIVIDSTKDAPASGDKIKADTANLETKATVYYKDVSNATRPVGIEYPASMLFDDGSAD